MSQERLVPLLLALVALLSLAHAGGLAWAIILARRVRLKEARLLEELAHSEGIRGRLLEAAAAAEAARYEAERARAEAEEADRAKTRFLASVGHELRTPLHGIIGSSRLLERKGLKGDQAELLGRIQISASQLFRGVTDLLDLSRAESGKLSLAPAVFSLAEFLGWLEPLLRAEVEERGLRFDFSFEGPKTPLRADRERIAQIVFNLVGNAAKFTERGSVGLRIGHGEGSLELVVEDTGPGIEEGERARIFTPFYQGRADQGRYRSGLGLGLAIVAALAEEMGGSVALESELGRGSRFSVRIAVEEAGGLEPPSPGSFSSAAAKPSSAFPGAGGRFLVAEDEGLNLLYITSLLELGGVASRAVDDGEVAIAAFREESFDLVLLDLGMPKLDGLAVARAARRIESEAGRPRTPIVALTARAYPEDMAACREAGMDGFIAKPFAEEAFWAELDRVFHLAREPASRG